MQTGHLSNRNQKNLKNSLSFSDKNNVNENIEQFSNLIYNIASSVFEQNSYIGKRPPVPWWNKTIKHAISKKRHHSTNTNA